MGDWRGLARIESLQEACELTLAGLAEGWLGFECGRFAV